MAIEETCVFQALLKKRVARLAASSWLRSHGYEAISAQQKRIYLAAQAVSAVHRLSIGFGSSMTLHTFGQETSDNRRAFKRAHYWFWRYFYAGFRGAPRLELRAPRDKAALAELHQLLQPDRRVSELNEFTWGIYRGCDFESEVGRYKTCVKQLLKEIDFRLVRKRWEIELRKDEPGPAIPKEPRKLRSHAV